MSTSEGDSHVDHRSRRLCEARRGMPTSGRRMHRRVQPADPHIRWRPLADVGRRSCSQERAHAAAQIQRAHPREPSPKRLRRAACGPRQVVTVGRLCRSRGWSPSKPECPGTCELSPQQGPLLGISRSTRRALTAAELLASDRAFNELVGNFCEAYGVAYGAGMAPEKGYFQCVIAVRDA
jgi:hypothetical protein